MNARVCLLFVFGLALLIPVRAQATVTCSTTHATSTPFTADETPDLSLTIPADANRATGLVIHDRTGAATIDSVSDSGSGTWTLRWGPSTSGSIRTWGYERTGGSTGAITVTVDFSSAINSALAGASCTSDAGALTFSAADATPATGTSTDPLSDAVSVPSAGVILGFIASSNSTSLSAVGTNQTNLTVATGRAHIVSRPESSGTPTIDATLSGSSAWMVGTMLFLEPVAGGGAAKNLTLLGVGL